FAVAHFAGARFDVPSFAGKINEELSRSRSGLAHSRNGPRRRAASSGDTVFGNEACVSHQQLNAIRGNAQLFGGGLSQFCPRSLASFDFADHYGDGAAGSQMYACADGARAGTAKAS